MVPVIYDPLTNTINGIPAPILDNAVKAFNRLFTAAVEIPAAFLEGIASEQRAESSARVKLIETSAEQIASGMHTDLEFSLAASTKFAKKIIRERVNINRITQIASDELKSESTPEANKTSEETPPISEDWLNVFESEAAQMSSEQMQSLFAKILAGEIRRPSSYSIRTVKILAQLDNTAAALFKILCSLCISLRLPNTSIVFDARVVSFGSAGDNSLQAYSLSFGQLNILQECGLIIADYNSWKDYGLAIARNGNVQLAATYLGEQWGFVPKEGVSAPPDLKLNGVALTQSGMELLQIVDQEPNQRYTSALLSFLDQRGLIMTRVTP
jgi:Protein of unknown function (DUF2806)